MGYGGRDPGVATRHECNLRNSERRKESAPVLSRAEKEQLRSDLRRWVQHCLQMDHALAAAEKRAAPS